MTNEIVAPDAIELDIDYGGDLGARATKQRLFDL